MIGAVDEAGRALITFNVRAGQDSAESDITAWVDTAFNGELVMPRKMIEALKLEQSAGIEARLADGNTVTLESFTCWLNWFDRVRPVEVIANDGEFPLLGIGLLLGRRLAVDYVQSTVAIE